MRTVTVTDASIIDALGQVVEETRRARDLHPWFPDPVTDPVRGVAVVVEEVGEAMKEALDMTRGRLPDNVFNPSQACWKELKDELRQTAATAVIMMAAMDSAERSYKS